MEYIAELAGNDPNPLKTFVFALYGTWELLNKCKIFPRGVGMICPYFWEIVFLLILVPFPAIWELAARGPDGDEKVKLWLGSVFGTGFFVNTLVAAIVILQSFTHPFFPFSLGIFIAVGRGLAFFKLIVRV